MNLNEQENTSLIKESNVLDNMSNTIANNNNDSKFYYIVIFFFY